MISLEKQTLRVRGLESLRALGPEDRAAKSLMIGRHLAGLSGMVFGFAPLRLEPDWLSGWGGTDFALPRVDGERLVFHRVTARGEMALSSGPFGTREPADDVATRMNDADAATVLVPGLAFDHTGGRLGRGAGFYDRFLANPALRARKVGVGFACQVVERVPMEAHDAPLDAIVTEDGWLELRNNGRDRD